MDDDELYDEDEELEDGDDIFEVDFDVDALDDIPEINHTYRIDYQRKRIRGFTDDVEAIAQSAWKILQTRRFAHLIYDDQYGNDLFNKINESTLTPAYMASEVPRMAEEALLADPRILEVVNFKWEKLDDVSVHINLEIRTDCGQVKMEGVIDSVD